MYKPLPTYLTIKPSEIDGLGLFTNDNIDAQHLLGITHVRDDRFQDGYIRTPLGGFFNHSIEPNCYVEVEGDFIKLITLREIKAGEEITAYYNLYDPTNK